MTDVRPLPALNHNYDPPRPWQCLTHAPHQCDGPVIGSIGSLPVCAPGAVAEADARLAETERIARLMDEPDMRRAVAAEIAFERRYS